MTGKQQAAQEWEITESQRLHPCLSFAYLTFVEVYFKALAIRAVSLSESVLRFIIQVFEFYI